MLPSHCSSLQEAYNNAFSEKLHHSFNLSPVAMSNYANSQAAATNAYHNHLNNFHHSQTTAIVTPNSATQLENLLNHFDLAKKSPSTETAPHSVASSASSYSPPPSSLTQQAAATGKSSTSSASFLQRPNNLNLKHQQASGATSSPNSLTTSVLMQSLAMNIFNIQNAASSGTLQNNPFNHHHGNLNLLMTPTIQLNTPTLYAITPIESYSNANGSSGGFNNLNTPVIQTSQQFMHNQSLNNNAFLSMGGGNGGTSSQSQSQSNKSANNSDSSSSSSNSANIKV